MIERYPKSAWADSAKVELGLCLVDSVVRSAKAALHAGDSEECLAALAGAADGSCWLMKAFGNRASDASLADSVARCLADLSWSVWYDPAMAKSSSASGASACSLGLVIDMAKADSASPGGHASTKRRAEVQLEYGVGVVHAAYTLVYIMDASGGGMDLDKYSAYARYARTRFHTALLVYSSAYGDSALHRLARSNADRRRMIEAATAEVIERKRLAAAPPDYLGELEVRD